MTPPNITPQELREIAKLSEVQAAAQWGYWNAKAERRWRLIIIACERWANEIDRSNPSDGANGPVITDGTNPTHQ